MTTYRYTNLMEYLPVRYDATPQQEKDRRKIYDFKNGICSLSLMERITDRINKLVELDKSHSWRICFIPASTHLKTSLRYTRLAQYIREHTNCQCDIMTITKEQDGLSGHIYGKKRNPAADFDICKEDVRNKNIIVFDDVITRGNTFCGTADKLENCGANLIIGLFLAKTINPDVLDKIA